MADSRSSTSRDSNPRPANPRRYENWLVILLFLTWGTVFLDRMSLIYLGPYIIQEFHLTAEQLGLLVSVLAIAWAFSSLIFGAVSDDLGRRPVLIPAVFIFSVLSWLSGMARSFTQLAVARGLMGAAEGPTWSTIAATVEESSAPERRGRNVGIVVSAAALVGLALAPVLTTQVAARVGWRSAFFIVGAPGIVLGFVIWKFVREPEADAGGEHRHARLGEYLSLLRFRNIGLCCVASAGFMTWLFVMNAFAPVYITSVSRHSATLAGFVIGASGLGAFLWGLFYPYISDFAGRKNTLSVCALISAVVPLTYQVPLLIQHPWLMAAAGFVANGGQGIAALAIVLIPTETVGSRFAGTAIGLTTLVGEIFGGALAPAIAGGVADRHGLGAALWIASGGALLVLLAALFMRETAPARLPRAQSSAI